MSDAFTPFFPNSSSPNSNRNFSHPLRQRAAPLSTHHNQDNPPMAPNDSRHFLPFLPSAIFSRSTSDLHSEAGPHSGYDFSYNSSRRPTTARTSYSVPDLTLTALPPPPLPPLPNLRNINIQPPSPKKLVKSPPRSPTKSNRPSGWRRLGRKVKRAFRFGRQRRRGSREVEEGGVGLLEIGSPTDFRHVETYGIGPLRPSGPPSGVAQEMTVGRYDGEGRDGGLGGGLGSRDVEGTAVEDDGASEWEDYEETRIFTPQASMGRKA